MIRHAVQNGIRKNGPSDIGWKGMVHKISYILIRNTCSGKGWNREGGILYGGCLSSIPKKTYSSWRTILAEILI